MTLEPVAASLPALDVLLLRTFYLAASALVLVIQAVPALQSRFLAYGSRATSSSSEDAAKEVRPSAVDQLLDYVASFRVPHNYFTHFYVVSVGSSLYWLWNLRHISAPQDWHLSDLFSCDAYAVSTAQVQLLWVLMFLQGVRRLSESYAYTSSSKSGMWFGHWVLGILFYLATNMAIWTENLPVSRVDFDLVEEERHIRWRLAILTPAILTCHWLQHSYHAYLYRLKTESSTYQLPHHPLFPNLLCPHYTCETMIYLLLSFLAAPSGRVINWTLVSATVFVAVNLGVTANGTKEWYGKQFGVEKVKNRRKMIPWMW